MRLLSLLAASASVAQAALKWQNVRFGGGGGFVPGIEFHPTAKGVAYARTDIGGLYRLNADDSWTPLTDSTGVDATWYVETQYSVEHTYTFIGAAGALMRWLLIQATLTRSSPLLDYTPTPGMLPKLKNSGFVSLMLSQGPQQGSYRY